MIKAARAARKMFQNITHFLMDCLRKRARAARKCFQIWNNFSHLCTVFHSTHYTIILKRYAYKLSMLQEPDENLLQCTRVKTWSNQKCNRDSRFCTLLYSEHIFGKPIEKTHTRWKMKRWEILQLLWNGTKLKTNKARVLCTREWKSATRSPWMSRKNRKRKRKGGGGAEEVEHAESVSTT